MEKTRTNLKKSARNKGLGILIMLLAVATLFSRAKGLAELRNSDLQLEIGSTQVNQVDDAELVFVPAGEFTMGKEDSIHPVYLDDFWIYKREVTNKMFADFLDEFGNQTEGGRVWLLATLVNEVHIHQSDEGWQADAGFEVHPVVYVTWYGARAYCNWVGGRLPTEAEWEKAARGTDGRTFPWGEGINCSFANFYGCSDSETVPVGSFPRGASPYGALDMAGNAWEWVADWFDWNYYQYTQYENPLGPDHGIVRVLRGGSWESAPEMLAASFRLSREPTYPSDRFGFRCVQSEINNP
jgi:formylglycine-generating enzyme required for sulfatase activity